LIEIRLLGSYEVRLDGATVEIPSRPAKLLLAYLALSAGATHPRERVAGILWPDSDETGSRSNLRQALWRLRQAIGHRYLIADNRTVAFDGGPDSLLDFELLEDPTDDDLLAAVSAYKGELLPGFYEEWVLLERGRLQAAFERKIQRLLDTLVEKQAWPEVSKWAEHWIAFGEEPESAYRALMVAHAARGDLAAVNSDFARCASALQQKVGVEPSEETRALYDSLLRGEVPTVREQSVPTLSETVSRPRHDLPRQSTPFIGREREIAEARQLLTGNRLLTVLGPGGMGKTRLAIQLAGQMLDEFRNGVYFVSLAPIDSADHLIQTIAEAIGFPLSTDEAPKRQLLRHLRNRQYLLLIDNFEHLLDGAGLVAEILQSAHDVMILVTSRERLKLQAESILSIDGLAYPRSGSGPEALEYESVRLFLSSARRLRPGFALRPDNLPEVARICRMVQGMPLGIQLAAAWVDMLSPAEIAAEMSRSLDFLHSEWRDAPERHRSVRAAIESSWRRLTETQRQLLSRLSVFRGGFTLEAAQEVTGATLLRLAGLVHKSLIRRDMESGRYGIHELLRQFAWQRLEANPDARPAIDKAHAVYFANYMEKRWDYLADSRQLSGLAEIEADLENVRRAWRYWLQRRDAGRIRKFLDTFWRVYMVRGSFNVAAQLYSDAVSALRSSLAAAAADSLASIKTVCARALALQAFFLSHLGDIKNGLAAAEESVSIMQGLGRIDELALPLISYRFNAIYAGSLAPTLDIAWVGDEIAPRQSSEWMQAYALCWQGREAGLRHDHEAAQMQVEESYRMFEARGDAIATIWPGLELGNLAIMRGALDEARQQYERVFRICQASDMQWETVKVTRYLGAVAAMAGEQDEARDYLRQCLTIADELGLPRDVINAVYEIAAVEAASGDATLAVRLLTFIRSHPLSDQTRTLSIWTEGTLVRMRDQAKALLTEPTRPGLDPGKRRDGAIGHAVELMGSVRHFRKRRTLLLPHEYLVTSCSCWPAAATHSAVMMG
jgi:predicted ATPase/DNA-binding SARP family transcriptional activator